MNWRLIISVVVVILAGAGIWWLVSRNPVEVVPGQITRDAEDVNVPETAKSLDGYVYLDESGVYLRSAFSTSTMKIPDAHADSFRVIVPLTQYTDQAVTDFCKGPGNYGVYADRRKTYFFQFWKTPTFSKTKIEVVKALDADTVAPAGAHTFTAASSTMRLGYQFATTSCEFKLEPVAS